MSESATAPAERILIVSTPKTGNTWVKHLLSAIYGLPIASLPLSFSTAAATELGPRWIAHAHYFPSRSLLDWAAQNQVVLVTTLRHPGDTLVSLQRYVQAYADDPDFDRDLAQLLAAGDDADARLAEFVRHAYFCDLSISISWMRLGCSRLIRYEDLWREPVAALERLTASIQAVPAECIERAVDRCALGVLRSNAGKNEKFFRKGSVGDWQSELPPAIHSILREQSPYPEQFAFLGYQMTAADPLIARPRLLRQSLNPFESITEFANGVPVPRIAAVVFLSFETESTRHWLPADRVDADSFFAWLVAADEREARADGLPRFTNLASYIYDHRVDLQQTIPDARGADRVKFMRWFLTSAASEYELHDAFIEPIRGSFMAWANAPANEDPNPDSVPLMTNYLAYIWGRRADLRQEFPDPWGMNRMDLVNWFLTSGRLEVAFGKDLAVALARSWTGPSQRS